MSNLNINELCDIVLREVYDCNGHSATANMIHIRLGSKYFETTIKATLHILVSDEFARWGEHQREHIFLTSKGIAFLHKDSYVKRSHRWELEYKTKKFTYRFRWLTWALSTIAILVSIAAYFKPSKTQLKILPLQERKCP